MRIRWVLWFGLMILLAATAIADDWPDTLTLEGKEYSHTGNGRYRYAESIHGGEFVTEIEGVLSEDHSQFQKTYSRSFRRGYPEVIQGKKDTFEAAEGTQIWFPLSISFPT